MTQIDKSRFEWIGSDSARREGISRPSTTFWKDATDSTQQTTEILCINTWNWKNTSNSYNNKYHKGI